MRPLPKEWQEPPWEQALDTAACLTRVPRDATLTGMFLEAVAGAARQRGYEPKNARKKYTAFQRYPLLEHCSLLVEVAQHAMPQLSIRENLRKLGRGAAGTLVQSLIGRVVMGTAEGTLEMLRALAKSYVLHMRPASVDVVVLEPGRAVVRMADIYNFLDSHNVGVFEGLFRHAGVTGSVRLASYSPTEADFLCEWR
jgi:uncharacterized protein (TIGR02265 family)